MFGMGFFEIFLVLVVAIIALGPEKLPGAAVEVVKFFKKFKGGIEDAKSTIHNELQLDDMKREAENFQSSLTNITATVEEAADSVTHDVKKAATIDLDEEKKEEKAEKPKKEDSSKKETISFKTEENK